jgi:hypothetical protein
MIFSAEIAMTRHSLGDYAIYLHGFGRHACAKIRDLSRAQRQCLGAARFDRLPSAALP